MRQSQLVSDTEQNIVLEKTELKVKTSHAFEYNWHQKLKKLLTIFIAIQRYEY